MTPGEYQRAAARTLNHDLSNDMQMLVLALGMCGEAGELADHIKKHIGQGHDLDYAMVRNEAGDLLWYVANLLALCNIDLDIIMQQNIAKLQRRYPAGFSEEASREREKL